MEYDPIASDYRASKQLAFRRHIEQYSLLTLCGHLDGQRVLDLACGEGWHSRTLRQRGARRVIGVDISSEMISLARASEADSPIGCQYFVHDAATLGAIGTFDLAVGMYLLNYASSVAQLESFLRAVHVNLRCGGRFVGMNNNPANAPEHFASYARYGFVKEAIPPFGEGGIVRYHFHKDDGGSFSVDNFHLDRQTYEEAFARAGFVDFTWHAPFLDPDTPAAETAHWDIFMTHPPVIAFSARKPTD
ncbi:MAG TPA: class I SAM-dependent methyltransferase [Luteibacter sp.]|jgi:toxoflavin synthase|nr:class I SAM-dependent methyltransferase [Luteibacter sp.]